MLLAAVASARGVVRLHSSDRCAVPLKHDAFAARVVDEFVLRQQAILRVGIICAINLSVRKRRKVKRITGERQPLAASRLINETWSTDFVMDALANGRRIKCLTVVDDFSRECVEIAVDHGMGGEYVVRLLDQAVQFGGYPLAIRTDQGPEFTSRAFMAWAAARGVRHLLNDVGCPTQNAYIESFNREFRDECLNEQWFESLAQATGEIARWRRDYNEVRPHRSLGRISPAKFAALHRQRAGDARQSPKIK